LATHGAILATSPGRYEVADLELDAPRSGELTVQLAAAGLCHSDDHTASGDMQFGIYPFCGGHEGAGIVVEVGPYTPGFAEGDHVVCSFIPGCGRCRWCATGQQNLCDLGATLMHGSRFDDPNSYRMRLTDGTPVGQMNGISTFSEFTTVDVRSAVKLEPDLPLDAMCLLGCGVGTGWGAAVNSAEVQPGHTVIVMGVGGVGMNAVQGAAHAGADHVIAVDPVEFKRTSALHFGATEAVASMDEAAEIARSRTNGQGADSAIVTVGVTTGHHVAQAYAAVRKAGIVVITGVGPGSTPEIPLADIIFYQKRIQGSLYGQCSPSFDILRQVQMYRDGRLKLDELITTRYKLNEVAVGYDDMHAGRNIRGIIEF
jgi:S-(hydroxymethyl)glutathione dehydrogenase/alcohol dehydrogenase